ncbi:MAG: SprT-like domain-containing protein [Gemmatimonas sp.]
MRDAALAQLGFDFTDTTSVADSPTPSIAPRPTLHTRGDVATSTPDLAVDASRERPARGRSATRARTAVLFSRLQDLGLRGVDALVLMRTRTVMVSLIGRTLRVNEGYADAPESVLRAIVTFATSRTKSARTAARDAILLFEVDRPPAPRRAEPPRPGDLALMAQLTEAHRQLNAQHFDGTLTTLPIRLSGRMATRLAHFDPGSKHVPSEIVMSRKHVVRHGWREAMHTLLHEMVHQWQHETGAPVDHLAGFRKKAREVGIAPSARRDVMPLERRRRRTGSDVRDQG